MFQAVSVRDGTLSTWTDAHDCARGVKQDPGEKGRYMIRSSASWAAVLAVVAALEGEYAGTGIGGTHPPASPYAGCGGQDLLCWLHQSQHQRRDQVPARGRVLYALGRPAVPTLRVPVHPLLRQRAPLPLDTRIRDLVSASTIGAHLRAGGRPRGVIARCKKTVDPLSSVVLPSDARELAA